MLRVKFLSVLSKVPIFCRYAWKQQSDVFHNRGALFSRSYGKDIHRLKNGKVAVIGLPKSGNNWLMYLLADTLNIEAVHPYNQEYKSRGGVTIFHTPFSPSVLYKRDLVYAVYILRDIRDVITSFYYYTQTDDYRKQMDPSCYFETIESFYFEYFLSKLVPRYQWTQHAESYIERGVPLVKYENLCENPAGELERLFYRWGVTVTPENIRSAIDRNAIDKLRISGRKTWRQIPSTHFRKGGYGNYVNTLPQVILEDITVRFANYLRRWGYQCERGKDECKGTP